MTWERPDSVINGVTNDNLATAYFTIGATLNCTVISAGLSFARAKSLQPSLSLFVNDGHPTVAGTYLAALTVFDTLLKPAVANGQAYLSTLDSTSVLPVNTQLFLQVNHMFILL